MGVAAFFRRCALCAPIHFRQHLPRHDPADECVFRLLLCRLGQPDILPGRMNILFSDTRFDAGRPCFVCHLTLRLRAISRGERFASASPVAVTSGNGVPPPAVGWAYR